MATLLKRRASVSPSANQAGERKKKDAATGGRFFLPKSLLPIVSSPSASKLPVINNHERFLSVESFLPNRSSGPYVHRTRKPTLKQRIALTVDSHVFGRLWEMFDAILSLAFACLYIYNTRFARKESTPQALPEPCKRIDRALAVLIFLQFLPRIWIAENRPRFSASVWAYGTWVSCFSVLVSWVVDETESIGGVFLPDIDTTYMSAGSLIFLYPFRFVRLHESLSHLYKPLGKDTVLPHMSLIVRKAVQLATTILLTLSFLASYLHLVTYKQAVHAHKDPKLTFFDAFFFTAVGSITSMNLNAGVPDTVFSRIIVLLVILGGALFMPTRISSLVTLIKSKSKYEHSFKNPDTLPHVLVTGEFRTLQLIEFLREFFSMDHGHESIRTRVVILHPAEPDEELKLVLAQPMYSQRVTYVKGSAVSFRSLQKVKAASASAAFLLAHHSEPESDDLDEMDAQQMMAALSLKKYNRHMRLYAQILKAENASHFEYLANEVVCTPELVMGLLAQSILVPGLSSLLILLATSIATGTAEDLLRRARESHLDFMEEYIAGASCETYITTFSEHLVGCTFSEAAEVLFAAHGILLVGLAVQHEPKDSARVEGHAHFEVLLNPAKRIISGSEHVFVIAGDAEAADLVATFGMADGGLDISEVFGNQASEASGPSRFVPADLPGTQKSAAMAKTTRILPRGPGAGKTMASKSKLSFFRKAQTFDMPVDEQTPLLEGNVSTSPPNGSDGRPRVQRISSDGGPHMLIPQDAELHRTPPQKPLPLKGNDIFSTKFEDHILVCDCSHPSTTTLNAFVSTIRQSLDPKERGRYIVILGPNVILAEVLNEWTDVMYVSGSGTSRRDLELCNVRKAAKIVVLGPLEEQSNSRTADAMTLLTALNIESMNEREEVLIVIACSQRETFKLIGESETFGFPEADWVQALVRPSFMSGHVISGSQIQPLISQCFHNRHVLYLFKLFLGIAPLAEQVNGAAPITSSPIMEKYIGREYGALVRYLFRQSKVPIGLYRTTAHRGAALPYVVVNPEAATVLKKTDVVYIMGESH
ncbi:hypothetical protein SAICODRAFT_68490 [Saitoella complicata NRRL Y-17804]|uniref:Uncharacterized protein n=1 Tax=Saitoella complicata (strain BCRC 22490 / CBS 7301 / JCM 7358 / NBRC 10748 / NRRL Y-17804) TaxID=698492 RepID=A0A0E9NSP5_SAICN|nr:uncharacterized protein SAICODRAFT_68490 [Saitoella complicata NRRL Y-17804]ODQ56101.1 hypothetical protein SAICODRAFT_68490 [Saitoella complicata NRRL Y-17804]GAO52706.1 hypothetical protein G7K_6777-t1 [Saitoella complicata NRRL Y-17804]